MIYSKTSTTDLQIQLYKRIKLDGFTGAYFCYEVSQVSYFQIGIFNLLVDHKLLRTIIKGVLQIQKTSN